MESWMKGRNVKIVVSFVLGLSVGACLAGVFFRDALDQKKLFLSRCRGDEKWELHSTSLKAMYLADVAKYQGYSSMLDRVQERLEGDAGSLSNALHYVTVMRARFEAFYAEAAEERQELAPSVRADDRLYFYSFRPGVVGIESESGEILLRNGRIVKKWVTAQTLTTR